MSLSTESNITIALKAAPPISVSLSTIAGYPVSDVLVWATLIYTVLLVGHRVIVIVKELKNKPQT